MLYKIFFLLAKSYTLLLRGRFKHLGKNSIIMPVLNSANERFISIGDNVNIGAFCRINVATEFGGFKCHSVNKIRIKIGNNVDIGNNAFISANNNIEIGDHVIMSAYVFITDHDHGYSDINKDLHHQKLSEGGYVKIGNNVFLGVKCSILKNVTVGERSIIAANAVVTKDVPTFSMAAGNPAKIIKKYDFVNKQWVKL